MGWSSIQSLLLESWARISAPALILAIGLGLSFFAIWLLMDWRYGVLVSSLRKRLKVAQAQITAHEDGLGGSTLAEVTARLKRAEHHLAMLPPRRLSEEQKLAISAADCPPHEAPRLIVIYDPASPEIDRYAHDFVDAFAAAPGWNVVDERYPRLPASPFPGIGVGVVDQGRLTRTEQLVIGALRDAGVAFEVMPRSLYGADAEIIVASRGSEPRTPLAARPVG
jgi:hypothetical protein